MLRKGFLAIATKADDIIVAPQQKQQLSKTSNTPQICARKSILTPECSQTEQTPRFMLSPYFFFKP